MASRVKIAVEPTSSTLGAGGGGSRPKPPQAVARSASLEGASPVPGHERAKRRLTPQTVAGPPPRPQALEPLIGVVREGPTMRFAGQSGPLPHTTKEWESRRPAPGGGLGGKAPERGFGAAPHRSSPPACLA